MQNKIYRLTEPRKIETCLEEIKIDGSTVVVQPTYLSICHADQRYYQGKRSSEVLKQKLPMALIHEGIGKVVYDEKKEFEVGEYVVMVPNTPLQHDEIVADNYIRTSKFRGSGFDGFMQDKVQLSRDCVVALPDSIDKDVASFTEIVSVSNHVIDRFDKIAHCRRNNIGIWGEGNLGYITAALLKKRYPKSKINVFGVVEERLAEFEFADGIFRIDRIPDDMRIDHAFECVGNLASGNAINQIIDYINPEGTIGIMGVSEELVPINTRMILEKGLRLFGSSRSSTGDFKEVINLYQEHPDLVKLLKRVVGDVVAVKDIEDMYRAFELDIKNPSRKTVIKWQV